MLLTLATVHQILVGLVTVIILGFGVKPLLKHATPPAISLPPPNVQRREQWERVTHGDEGGKVLGYLERFLFFGAFWGCAYIVIGAWLTFKVASKWNVWSNVIAVPTTIEGIDPIDLLNARRHWGSHLLMTFLIGTLANLIIGFLGVLIGQYGLQLLRLTVY